MVASKGRTIATTVLCVPLLALFVASPVAAGGVTVTHEIIDLQHDCGGGLSFEGSLSDTRRAHDLGGGRVVTLAAVFGGVEATNGEAVRFRHAWREDFNPSAGTVTLTGLLFGAWVAGEPSISRIDAGRIVIDLATGMPISVKGRIAPGPFDPDAWTCDLLVEAGAS